MSPCDHAHAQVSAKPPDRIGIHSALKEAAEESSVVDCVEGLAIATVRRGGQFWLNPEAIWWASGRSAVVIERPPLRSPYVRCDEVEHEPFQDL